MKTLIRKKKTDLKLIEDTEYIKVLTKSLKNMQYLCLIKISIKNIVSKDFKKLYNLIDKSAEITELAESLIENKNLNDLHV